MDKIKNVIMELNKKDIYNLEERRISVQKEDEDILLDTLNNQNLDYELKEEYGTMCTYAVYQI